MAEAQIQETVVVPKDKLFQAIVRYEDYPSFVDGCKAVQVERPAPGKARVTYRVEKMKEISYTLDHVEDAAAGRMSWTLVQSGDLKKNIGGWELREAGPGRTEVKYTVDIEFNFPVPGFILKQLVKGSLPAMVKSFADRARGL